MNVTTLRPRVEDRAPTEIVLSRIAVCALTWYSGKAEAEPDYSFEKDQRWCLAPLADLEPGLPLRILVAATILDPSRHRDELIRVLVALGDE